MENVLKFPIDSKLIDSKNLKDATEMSVEPLNNFRELLTQGNKSEALGK